MKFEEIVADIVSGEKTTEQVFNTKRYARKSWPKGEYLGALPMVSSPGRSTLLVMRDEPVSPIARIWDTADEDRQADDWYDASAS